MISWNAIVGCAATLAATTCCSSEPVTVHAAHPSAHQEPVRDHGASPPASSAMPSAAASQPEPAKSDTAAAVGTENISDRHGRPVPTEYRCVLGFLDYLSRNYSALASADMDPALRPDPAVLTAYVDPNGVTFADADVVPSREQVGAEQRATKSVVKATLSPKEIEHQFRERRGIAFLRLTKLGHSYSLAHPNHSRLVFTPSEQRMVVGVGEGFELLFKRDSCRVVELHYLTIEVE